MQGLWSGVQWSGIGSVVSVVEVVRSIYAPYVSLHLDTDANLLDYFLG